MPKKNSPDIELGEEVFDDITYDFEASRHMLHRQQAQKKYLLRRRIEDLREEKELREQDFY